MSADGEFREDRPKPYRDRVRWVVPGTKKRLSRSECFLTEEEADDWIGRLRRVASRGVTPVTATMTLKEYGDEERDLARRGLESKTMDPYRAGWRLLVAPTLGHLPIREINNGLVDRAV